MKKMIGGNKMLHTLFSMSELLLCGVGNEIIYDKEQEQRQTYLDGMQRSSCRRDISANSLMEIILKEPEIPPIIVVK